MKNDPPPTHPPRRVETSDLRRDFAIALYREDILSFGKARELAGLGTYEFGQLLGERSIPRHYGEEELEEDLRFAAGEFGTQVG